MQVNQVFLIKTHSLLIITRIDTLSADTSTDILSFVFVCVLIIALFYSLITLTRQNKLIAQQNEEILLKNKQLEEQNKELIQINEEKSNLIGVVSHDLKSPFNRIFALVNLLKMTGEKLSEEQQEYLSKMHQVIKDGLALIRNLLDIRAIEDKGIKMSIEEIDMLRLLKEMLKAHKPLADIKHIKLKLSKNIDQLLITSDKLYISRIIENILSNALKFSKQNTSVEAKVSRIDDKYLKIEITDQGPGISSRDMEQLFQKFHVLSAKPTDGESSTGLGLSIVKVLVEKLGGEIYCESELNIGTKFSINLPLKYQGDI